MRNLQAVGLLAVLGGLMFVCDVADAQDFKAGDLTIEHPWTRATPGGAQVAGGYVTIVNKGSGSDLLIGGSIAVATKFELHQMATEGNVMKMRPTGPLEIPAGGALTLDTSGTHIMFTGLKRGLKKGETVDGTLVFQHAGTVPIRFDVEGIGARGPIGDPAKASMPGMDMN